MNWFSSRHWTCWHPSSWQGWLVTFLYVLSVLLIFIKAEINSYSVVDTFFRIALPFVLLSIIFVIICKKTSKNSR